MRRVLWIVFLTGCGGDPGVFMYPEQSNTAVALYGVVREVADPAIACDALWSAMSSGLAETRGCSTTPELLFFPVKVAEYSSLALFLYAVDNQQGALGGGCVVRDLQLGQERLEVTIPLAAPTMPSPIRSECLTH